MYCTKCRDTISNKMIRPRSGRRALSENDAIDISEAKKSEILSRFKSENSERNVSRNSKDISECTSSCKRCNERLLDVHDQISWNIQEKNQRELLESQFKCSICLEMVVKATLVVSNDVKDGIARRCGHTFCEDCINTSMESSDKCPLCQSKIFLTIPNHEVESCINQFVDEYFSNEAKTARANLLKEREEDKINSISEAKNRVPRGAVSQDGYAPVVVPPEYGHDVPFLFDRDFDRFPSMQESTETNLSNHDERYSSIHSLSELEATTYLRTGLRYIQTRLQSIFDQESDHETNQDEGSFSSDHPQTDDNDVSESIDVNSDDQEDNTIDEVEGHSLQGISFLGHSLLDNHPQNDIEENDSSKSIDVNSGDQEDNTIDEVEGHSLLRLSFLGHSLLDNHPKTDEENDSSESIDVNSGDQEDNTMDEVKGHSPLGLSFLGHSFLDNHPQTDVNSGDQEDNTIDEVEEYLFLDKDVWVDINGNTGDVNDESNNIYNSDDGNDDIVENDVFNSDKHDYQNDTLARYRKWSEAYSKAFCHPNF